MIFIDVLIVFFIILFGFIFSKILTYINFYILNKKDYLDTFKSENINIKLVFNYKKYYFKFVLIDLFSIFSLLVIYYKNSSFLFIIFLLFCLLGCISDILEGYILDIYNLSGMLLLIIFSFIIDNRLENIVYYFISSGIVLLIFLIILLLMGNKMGLGDVKLFILIAFYYGLIGILCSMILSSLIGLLIGIVLLIIRKNNSSFIFGPFIFTSILLIEWFDLISFYNNLMNY